MGRVFFVLLVIVMVTIYSCSNGSDNTYSSERLVQNAVLQQQDGTISLEVDDADTYHDMENPESNTAEWSVLVSKSGRYDIWLASATKDTTNLEFDNSVMLSIKDDFIEARPAIDRVIQNSTDVNHPYYRTDSFMGSLYIRDTGLYNIQVISDKILPENESTDNRDTAESTKILSVFLTPAN